jgi:hypothetical protein
MAVLFSILGGVSALVILTALIGGHIFSKTSGSNTTVQSSKPEAKPQGTSQAARTITPEALTPTR